MSSFLEVANNYSVVWYGLFWLVRINGCIRRGKQPLLRGQEWFFSVPVESDFYTGAGRRILLRYWMRMFVPFALDIPLAIAIFVSGRFLLLNWLILMLCAVIHINHVYSVDLAERQARAFVAPEAEEPVARMALSLKPRRLRDYTNAKVEWLLGLSSLVALAGLARYYFADSEQHNARLVFGVPLVLLYLQLGLLLAKRIIVAWRSPVPQAQANEYMRVREETRSFYLMICDWHRGCLAAAMLFWPIEIRTSAASLGRLMSVWLYAWLALGMVATVWVEIKRKQLVKMGLQARPAKLPDFLRQTEIARWPVCYLPAAPVLVLKGARGYSLNLANTMARLSAAYLAGLVVLVALLRWG